MGRSSHGDSRRALLPLALGATALAGCQLIAGIKDLPLSTDTSLDATTDASVDTTDTEVEATVADALDASTEAPACEAGAVGCSGDTPTVCFAGAWQPKPPCADPTPVCDPQSGTCVSARSCLAGTPGAGNDCGNGSVDDCCASRLVIGGNFARDNDPDAGFAFVSDFRLDRYEVTTGRFRTFVAAGMGTQSNPPAPGTGAGGSASTSGWSSSWIPYLPTDTAALKRQLNCASFPSWTDVPGANERLPMNCLSWYEAFAFCVWDGGRLATEAEWNYAAAHGPEQRVYPWGSATPDKTFANFNCATDPCQLSTVGFTPLGAGAWGQMDLAGNVEEWVLDCFGPYPPACADCVNVTSCVFPSPARAVRGGSTVANITQITTSFRQSVPAPSTFPDTGARCARALH